MKIDFEFKDIFVDFGKGFKFIIESFEHKKDMYSDSLILKCNSNSLKWVEIEHELSSNYILNLKQLDQLFAEENEKKEEYFRELIEDLDSDYLDE